MLNKWVLAVALCVAGTAAVTVLPAQDKRNENANIRAVQGVVTDTESNPVEQAVVQIKDTKSLQVRSFITRKDGTYHFNGLSPNVDYELRAEFQTFSSDTKTLSNFDNRKNATINLTIKNKK